MNTVRAAQVTKSGNPLSDKSLVELTLRAMPPATESIESEILLLDDEVAA
jgi:hypothetical protein